MIAIRDHDLSRGQRRRDDLRDQLPARGHEQVHLRLWIDVEALVEKDVANLLAELGPSRLAHENGVLVRQPVVQQLGLRRLARALGALEGDEQPPLHRPGSVVATRALRATV